MLKELWEQTLGLERIDVLDNFFELGGNSINGAVLINKLQQSLSEYVPVVALFDAPTVAELASYLTTHFPEEVSSLANEGDAYVRLGDENIDRVRQLIVQQYVRLEVSGGNMLPPYVLLWHRCARHPERRSVPLTMTCSMPVGKRRGWSGGGVDCGWSPGRRRRGRRSCRRGWCRDG